MSHALVRNVTNVEGMSLLERPAGELLLSSRLGVQVDSPLILDITNDQNEQIIIGRLSANAIRWIASTTCRQDIPLHTGIQTRIAQGHLVVAVPRAFRECNTRKRKCTINIMLVYVFGGT